MNWPRILASTARPSSKDSRAWASSSNPRRRRWRPRSSGVSRNRSRSRHPTSQARPPTSGRGRDPDSTAGRPRRLRVPVRTAPDRPGLGLPFPVPRSIPCRSPRPRPHHGIMTERTTALIPGPGVRTSIVRISMTVVRVRVPRAVPMPLVSGRTHGARPLRHASPVLVHPRAPRERLPARIPPLVRVRGTIPSAASRGCMCPLRATSPGLIPWPDRPSSAGEAVPVRADGEGSVLVRVRDRRLVPDSGDSIAAPRAPEPVAPAAVASAEAFRRGLRPAAPRAVGVVEPRAPSDVRAASHRAPGRTVCRRGVTSRRSRLPSSEV